MDDLYSALISGVPNNGQTQAALAAQIRKQALLGQLGEASGDRVMGPAGHALLAEADTGAHQLGEEREKQQQQDILQNWHNTENQHWQAQQAQAMKIAQMTDSRQRELNAALLQNKLDLQDLKNDGKPAKPIPVPDKKELEQMQDSLTGVQGAAESYKSGFGGTGRNAENWAARTVPALTTQSMQDAQNWWANYGRQFTLPELKATIGLRHNNYMQNLFESYHLDPNMNDAQLTKNLGQISTQLENRIKRRVRDLQDQGYNIGGFENYLPGENSPPPSKGYLDAARQATQAPMQGAPQAAPQAAQPAPQPAPVAPQPPQQQPPGNLLQNALRSGIIQRNYLPPNADLLNGGMNGS